jgi:hypothetical protein
MNRLQPTTLRSGYIWYIRDTSRVLLRHRRFGQLVGIGASEEGIEEYWTIFRDLFDLPSLKMSIGKLFVRVSLGKEQMHGYSQQNSAMDDKTKDGEQRQRIDRPSKPIPSRIPLN